MGIHTGVDISAVAGLSRRMEVFLGRDLPAKMHKLLEPVPQVEKRL
jgi:hypothetical protein